MDAFQRTLFPGVGDSVDDACSVYTVEMVSAGWLESSFGYLRTCSTKTRDGVHHRQMTSRPCLALRCIWVHAPTFDPPRSSANASS